MDNRVKCPICFDFYSEMKIPKAMPCGHTICSDCINQIRKECGDDSRKYDSDYYSSDEYDSFNFSFENRNKKSKKSKPIEDNIIFEYKDKDSTTNTNTKNNKNEDDFVEVASDSNGDNDSLNDDDANEEEDEEDEEEESEESEESDDDDDDEYDDTESDDDITLDLDLEDYEEDTENRIIPHSDNKDLNNAMSSNKNVNKFKFKCPYCSKRVKLSLTDFITNTEVLKYNNDIIVNNSNSVLNNNNNVIVDINSLHCDNSVVVIPQVKTFCKICSKIINKEQHACKYSSQHSEYFVQLTPSFYNEIKHISSFTKSNSLLNESIASSSTFIYSFLHDIFSNETHLQSIIHHFTHKLKSSSQLLRTTAKAKHKFISNYNTFTDIISTLHPPYNTTSSTDKIKQLQKIISHTQQILSKYNSLKYFSLTKTKHLHLKLPYITSLFSFVLLQSLTIILTRSFFHSIHHNTFHLHNQFMFHRAHSTKLFSVQNILLHADHPIEPPLSSLKLNYKNNLTHPNGAVVYFFGTKNESSRNFCAFNEETNTLTYLNKMPIQFKHPDTLLYKNFIIIAGGKIDDDMLSKQCFVYSIDHNKWHTLPDLNFAKNKKCVIVVNDEWVYAFGGKASREVGLSYKFERLLLNVVYAVVEGGSVDMNNKWEEIVIRNYFETIYNFGYFMYSENVLVILGGFGLVGEDFNEKGFIIDLNKRKLIHTFSTKGFVSSNYGIPQMYRGYVMSSDKNLDYIEKFNIWSQLDKINIDL